MVILDVSVPAIGRFLVKDDLSLEEVLLLPSTTDVEMKTLTETMLRKDSPWKLKSNVLLAALSSTFNIDAKLVTFHSNTEPSPSTEPEPD